MRLGSLELGGAKLGSSDFMMSLGSATPTQGVLARTFILIAFAMGAL